MAKRVHPTNSIPSKGTDFVRFIRTSRQIGRAIMLNLIEVYYCKKRLRRFLFAFFHKMHFDFSNGIVQ